MYRSITSSPYASRAASRLWALQTTLQLSTVEGPPRPRGTTWSISVRASEPQIPPEASFHWHFPPSRFITSRFTRGGTEARRFACWASKRSSAASITCSSVAPGWTCDCPRRAFLSLARSSREAVRWIRLCVAVRGSTTVRDCSDRLGESSPR